MLAGTADQDLAVVHAHLDTRDRAPGAGEVLGLRVVLGGREHRGQRPALGLPVALHERSARSAPGRGAAARPASARSRTRSAAGWRGPRGAASSSQAIIVGTTWVVVVPVALDVGRDAVERRTPRAGARCSRAACARAPVPARRRGRAASSPDGRPPGSGACSSRQRQRVPPLPVAREHRRPRRPGRPARRHSGTRRRRRAARRRRLRVRRRAPPARARRGRRSAKAS